MKLKLLMQALQGLDPETEINFSLGGMNADKYREECAILQLAKESCLEFLEADEIRMYEDTEEDNRLMVMIELKQGTWEPVHFHDLVEAGREELKEKFKN